MTFTQIPAQFWQQLAESPHPHLMLDYDGTLAPFRIDRDQAYPYSGVREVLTAIRSETLTRLVIISGRAIDDLLPLLGMDPPPEIWGCHGWERLLPSGVRAQIELPPQARSGLLKAASWAEQQALEKHCEVKPASLAVHWRGLPIILQNALKMQVNASWIPLADHYGLEIHPFDGGLELRCPGRDKGSAVREVLAESGPGSTVVFMGDDRTDEDGFRVLQGQGLGILVRNDSRPSTADVQLHPPEELLAFLEMWRDTAMKIGANLQVN